MYNICEQSLGKFDTPQTFEVAQNFYFEIHVHFRVSAKRWLAPNEFQYRKIEQLIPITNCCLKTAIILKNHVIWRFKIYNLIRGFTKAFWNFAKFIVAYIFAKFKYFTKQLIYCRQTDIESALGVEMGHWVGNSCCRPLASFVNTISCSLNLFLALFFVYQAKISLKSYKIKEVLTKEREELRNVCITKCSSWLAQFYFRMNFNNALAVERTWIYVYIK